MSVFLGPDPNNPSAERRARELNANYGGFLSNLISEAVRIVDGFAPIDIKRRSLVTLADEFCEFITPRTVCREGCSHCCYQAVAVTNAEAAEIGKYIGKTPSPVSDDILAYVENNAGQLQYEGTPCTFLKEGRCSIYSVRPFVCRLHHSLNDASGDCVIGTNRYISAFNIFELQTAYLALGFKTIADIRDYFPKE